MVISIWSAAVQCTLHGIEIIRSCSGPSGPM